MPSVSKWEDNNYDNIDLIFNRPDYIVNSISEVLNVL